MTDSPNYCQHPECHNSHYAYYGDQWTGTWTPARVGKVVSYWPMPGARRWCHSHALINEGVSIG